MIENDSELFKVDVENYNGPLDVLLDLAKAQKVNLEDISITKLADQFHEFITQEKKIKFTNSFRIVLTPNNSPAIWLSDQGIPIHHASGANIHPTTLSIVKGSPRILGNIPNI